MPWYKSGTVSVTLNSNAVIGTGTAFLSNSRVGDAFRGPDGGWYEVTNIASDTAMSISPTYKGATAAAGAYALAPMQGYVKDSADALRALVNTYGTKLAALGSTANFEILPVANGGTGSSSPSSARAALGLATPTDIPDAHLALTLGVTYRLVSPWTNSPVNGYPCSITVLRYDNEVTLEAVQEGVANPVKYIKKRTGPTTWSAWSKFAINNAVGANADITSLSGLTTALSVGQGGTGVTSIAALVTALQAAGVYGKTNIVGNVSQVGGLPGGAVLETGTNASGTYTKYADGSMECRRSLIYPAIPITTAAGALYYAAGGVPGVGFAANFIAPPDVVINVKPSAGVVWHTVLGNPTVSSGPSLYLAAPNSLTVDLVVTQIAKGRWF